MKLDFRYIGVPREFNSLIGAKGEDYDTKRKRVSFKGINNAD